MLYLLAFGLGVVVGLGIASVSAVSRELGAEPTPNPRTGSYRGGEQHVPHPGSPPPVPMPKPAPMPNAPPLPIQRIQVEMVCRRCGKEWCENRGGEG